MSGYRAMFSRTAGRMALIGMLASIALPIEAQSQPPAVSATEPHAYDERLKVYRSGAIERAIEVLARLLAASEGQRQASRWISEARDTNRRSDLEAALLLFTDAVMTAWRYDDPYPTRLLRQVIQARPSSQNTTEMRMSGTAASTNPAVAITLPSVRP